jgi:exosortase
MNLQPTVEKGQSPAGRSLPWVQIAWFGGLLVLCYLPVLSRLVHNWTVDDNVSHGFFVPLVAAYIVWRQRDDLLSRQYQGSPAGYLVIAWGAAQLLLAKAGAELFLGRTAFLISLAGVVLALGGWALLRALAFPLVLLLFMIPLPAILYNQLTLPLQLLASRAAEHALSLAGIPVFREGNILELPAQRLNVVEACSGIRSLMSLSFLALVYGYLFDGRRWMKWVLLAATVPIAVVANSSRVAITGILGEIDPQLAQGIYHSLEGWVIFVAALLLLVAAHKLANLVAVRLAGASGWR